jgi:hypothetical protein
MTAFIVLITILQTFSISLGVGSSTLAIINFFVAIADSKIDETERIMMGVVYTVLKVAMVLILTTTIILISYDSASSGTVSLTAFSWGQITILFVLYTNAILMTYSLMPSTFGPALQSGSWYALGAMSSLQLLGYTGFSFTVFVMGYITGLILVIGIVNGIMEIMKQKRK